MAIVNEPVSMHAWKPLERQQYQYTQTYMQATLYTIHRSHFLYTKTTETHALLFVRMYFVNLCMCSCNVSSRLCSFAECFQYTFISSRINNVFLIRYNFNFKRKANCEVSAFGKYQTRFVK